MRKELYNLIVRLTIKSINWKMHHPVTPCIFQICTFLFYCFKLDKNVEGKEWKMKYCTSLMDKRKDGKKFRIRTMSEYVNKIKYTQWIFNFSYLYNFSNINLKKRFTWSILFSSICSHSFIRHVGIYHLLWKMRSLDNVDHKGRS